MTAPLHPDKLQRLLDAADRDPTATQAGMAAMELGWTYDSPALTPAEVAALKSERDAAVAERDQFVELARNAEAAERTLRAENERLRDALTEVHNIIAEGVNAGFTCLNGDDWAQRLQATQPKTSAALGDTP